LDISKRRPTRSMEKKQMECILMNNVKIEKKNMVTQIFQIK